MPNTLALIAFAAPGATTGWSTGFSTGFIADLALTFAVWVGHGWGAAKPGRKGGAQGRGASASPAAPLNITSSRFETSSAFTLAVTSQLGSMRRTLPGVARSRQQSPS